MRTIAAASLFNIVFQTCFYAISSEFLLLFLGVSILSVFPSHGGLQPPFINTVNAIYNRRILNNIESRVSIGVNKTYVFSLTEERFVYEYI